MTSQPDKLFRDKLENFQRPAPVGTWDKIENNLSKPDKKIIWLRIAAGIALLGAVAFVLWPADEEKQRIAVKQDQLPSLKKDETPKQVSPVQQTKPETIKSNLAKTKSVIVTKQKLKTPTVQENQHVIEKPIVVPVPEQKEFVAEVSKPEEKEIASTTITYSTAEVNAKFLKKKLPSQATPHDEDASGIQKLIGLAYTAKNSDAGLGDLRQKKDDILAFNFGKKKGEN